MQNDQTLLSKRRRGQDERWRNEMALTMMCVGGPHSGCLIDVEQKPVHGHRYSVSDWDVGLGTIPTAPMFSDNSETIEFKIYEYTFVQFSGDGLERWFLSFGTERGMWVLDELTQMARRKTLGDNE